MHRTVKLIIQIVTSTITVIAHDQLVFAILDDDSKLVSAETWRAQVTEVTHNDHCDA
jgi:hypothetical protein